MISIGQNGLGANVAELLHRQSLDSGTGGGADKGWGLDIAMRSVNDADPSQTI